MEKDVEVDVIVKKVFKKICDYYKEDYSKIDYYLQHIK